MSRFDFYVGVMRLDEARDEVLRLRNAIRAHRGAVFERGALDHTLYGFLPEEASEHRYDFGQQICFAEPEGS